MNAFDRTTLPTAPRYKWPCLAVPSQTEGRVPRTLRVLQVKGGSLQGVRLTLSEPRTRGLVANSEDAGLPSRSTPTKFEGRNDN